MMVRKSREDWITAGYALFAKEGPKGIKIEVVAKKVGISKSSFYHHFVDVTIYTDMLLTYHLERASVVAQQEKTCTNIDPEVIRVLLANRVDLLFNRQLRVHRDDPRFRKCFEASNRLAESALMEIWAREAGLPYGGRLVEILFALAVENFYLQITEETLTYEWLSAYFKNLRALTDEVRRL